MANSPRIYVSLDERTHEVFKRVARSQGKSASSVLREMAQGAVPSLEAYLELVAKIESLTDVQRRALRGELALFEGDLLQAAAEASSELSDALNRVTAEGRGAARESEPGHGRARERGGDQPPVFNKGAKIVGNEGGR